MINFTRLPPFGFQDRRSRDGLLRKGFDLVAFILRLLLWPVRRASELLLPPGEYDGLSPAVTEKAAQQFVQHLKSLTATSTQQALVDASFSTLGFEALRQEAVNTHSLIVVYLHSPLHRQADVFLRTTILSQGILEFLNQHNVKTFGSSIHTSQGSSLANHLGVASYPVFAMLQPSTSSSGTAKLVFKAEGSTLLRMQPNQLLPLLNGTYHRFQMVIAEEVARRFEREHEAELRRQQDEEYREALRVDQERERQRQEERENEERRIQEEQERERQIAEAETNRLETAKSMLRPEPASGGTRIQFQLPSGKKLDRRFENDETVASLKSFLTLHFAEHNPEIRNIALSTNFPKKNYDQDGLTLTDSGLAPQAVLMVQDLDA
jgi:FAS-associated factor 2